MNINACHTNRLLRCNSSGVDLYMPACFVHRGNILQSAAHLTATQWLTRPYKLNALHQSASQSSQSPAHQRNQPVEQDIHSGQQLDWDASQQQHATPDAYQPDIGTKGQDRKVYPGWPEDTTLEPCLHLIEQGQVPAALDLLQELSMHYGPPERDVGDAILMVRFHCLLQAPRLST